MGLDGRAMAAVGARVRGTGVGLLAQFTCPPGWAAALVRLGTVGLARAAVLARRADAGVVDLRLAATVGESQSAGAAEVHRVALGDGATGAAAQARRAEARVRKLTPAPGVSDLALALSVSIWTQLTLPLVQT